jgi:2Fe-2S ferredoxin
MCIPLKNELQTIVSTVITIVVKNLFGKMVSVPAAGQTVLRIFQEQRIDWMHSCGGKGRCTTCKFRVIRGMENLGEVTTAELHYAKQMQLNRDERLACQAEVFGDLELEVPDECKMAHISYSPS